jgi:hypothetical protein
MCNCEKEIHIIQLLLLIPCHAVAFARDLTFRPGFTMDCHHNPNKVLVKLHVCVVMSVYFFLLIMFDPCETCSSHGSDYEGYSLLGYDALLSGRFLLMFQRNMLPPSSWLKSDYEDGVRLLYKKHEKYIQGKSTKKLILFRWCYELL